MGMLLGWKRYEANSMLEFPDVDEKSVNSILRRSLVIWFKSQFLDADYINEHIPDAESKGISPLDHNPSCVLEVVAYILGGKF